MRVHGGLLNSNESKNYIYEPLKKIMNSLFRNPTFFVVSYLMLLLPTYLLPMLGSNSTVLNAIALGTGHGMLPQWWLHAWCLVMLILLAWLRGDFISKKYLPVFPVLAAIFDLTPGLNIIPFLPTVFHVVTIILAVKVAAELSANEHSVLSSPLRKVQILGGLMTLLAVIGSVFFMLSTQKSLTELISKKTATAAETVAVEATPPFLAAVSPAAPTPTKNDAPASGGKQRAATTHHPHVQQTATASGQGNASGKVQYININE